MPRETVEKIAPLPAPFQKKKTAEFSERLQSWLELTPAINELAFSLGHNRSYPFVVSPPVVRKLFFIDCMVKRQVKAAEEWARDQARKNRLKRLAKGLKKLVRLRR